MIYRIIVYVYCLLFILYSIVFPSLLGFNSESNFPHLDTIHVFARVCIIINLNVRRNRRIRILKPSDNQIKSELVDKIKLNLFALVLI